MGAAQKLIVIMKQNFSQSTEKEGEYDFALERTLFAVERTLLAYWRTGLAFIGAGLLIMKFFVSLTAFVAAVSLLIVGCALFLYSAQRYGKIWKRLKKLSE